jgi:glycosyltransferase involved in cell wall biosynthesis
MVPAGMALARAAREFSPDLLHFHSETPEACGAAMFRLTRSRARVPVVRTIHNSIFWRYWPRVGRWCDRQLEHAHIACVSAAALEEFRRYRRKSGAGSPPAEPVIIYNGVSAAIREPRGTPRQDEVRRVLFAGRFEDQKGTDVLCAALPQVRLPANTRGELVCMGHGAHQALVDALTLRPPTGWSVTARAPVSNLAAVFPEFDLVVVPSRFEGLGLVAIEATLAGLPVVTTDAPGLRETLPAGYPWRAAPGDPVSLASVLSLAMQETSRWRESVCAAQVFARSRFSPAAMAAGYRQLYERAVSR